MIAKVAYDVVIGALLGVAFAGYRSRSTSGREKLSVRHVAEYVVFGIVIMIAIEIRRYFLPV